MSHHQLFDRQAIGVYIELEIRKISGNQGKLKENDNETI